MSEHLPSVSKSASNTKANNTKAAKQTKRPAKKTRSLELPWTVAEPVGYSPRRVDLRHLTRKQRAGLNRLLYSCIEADKELENGTVVTRPIHAIKYVLEQLETMDHDKAEP